MLFFNRTHTRRGDANTSIDREPANGLRQAHTSEESMDSIQFSKYLHANSDEFSSVNENVTYNTRIKCFR
jgi:hypothetical protein